MSLKQRAKLFEQRTFETCLAMSFLFLVGRVNNPTKKLEMGCILAAMKYSKWDFVVGHLKFIETRFKISFRRIVDNKAFFDYLEKCGFVGKEETEVKKINLKLIDSLLLKSEIILYIDSYYFYKIGHVPHFIVVTSKKERGYQIFDPWDGRIKLIKAEILSKAVSSLRNYLKFCPEILIKK